MEQQQQLQHHQTLSSEAEPAAVPMDLGALLLATLQFFGESFDPFLTGKQLHKHILQEEFFEIHV